MGIFMHVPNWAISWTQASLRAIKLVAVALQVRTRQSFLRCVVSTENSLAFPSTETSHDELGVPMFSISIEWLNQRGKECASAEGRAFYKGLKQFGMPQKGDTGHHSTSDLSQTKSDDDDSVSTFDSLFEFDGGDSTSVSSDTRCDSQNDDFEEAIFDTNIIGGRTYSQVIHKDPQPKNFYPDDEKEASRQSLAPGGYLEIKDVVFPPRTLHQPLPESSAFRKWSTLMIDNAGWSGRDLMAMTRMKEMMNGVGFIDIIETTNQWPFHAQNRESKKFAEMVQDNFKEGIQGLSLGLLTETMPPEEVELHLANLRKEAKDERLQIYWPV
ncbi:hypothetical protein KXW25_003891 [Aspergillus fumigatus]|nr:hypothetical protein KXW25_003891 [Aspergillus fumigatus]